VRQLRCDGCGRAIREAVAVLSRKVAYGPGDRPGTAAPLPNQGQALELCANCGLIVAAAVVAIGRSGADPAAAAYVAAKVINDRFAEQPVVAHA
jgi:hypothetical protein